jgi:phosphotransferase system enzyme I (PtsP)
LKPYTWRQIVQEASAATSLDDSLAIMVRRVKSSLAVDVCAIYLIDRENDQLILSASTGPTAGDIGQARVDLHEGLLGLVAERRELVVLQKATAHPLYRTSLEFGTKRYDHFLGVPLIHNRQVLGILVVWRQTHGLSAEAEETFCVTLAPHLARAIYDVGTVREVTRMLGGNVEEGAFIQGVQAAAGLAIGTAIVLEPLAKLESTPDRPAQDVEAEETAFRRAVAAVQEELRSSRERLAAAVPEEVRALFDVYVLLLNSDRLVSGTIERIRAGNWAPGALRDTVAQYAQVFEQMEDPYVRARAEDIREVGQRVLLRLRSEAQESRPWPERCILVGDTVSISEIAAVPVGRLAGIVCRHGSALSHTAVLAHALGIPAVVSLASLPGAAMDDHVMVVDGCRGRIYIQPSPAVLDAFRRRVDDEKTRTEQLATLRHLPAETQDGVRLPLHANITVPSDTAAACTCGAEGVGLYRTEYLFLLRETFPVEEEQYALYREVLEAFAPQPVVFRTLDVGGDKILPYFPVEEDNPFLGCRGIRFSLDHPEIFLLQLRAMLRANAGLGNLSVLFPMISRVAELDDALELLDRAYRELLEEGQAAERPRVGVMIEVPSAVHQASTLARRVDFLSIGTNDLAQYMLAADRNNARVATPYGSFHPAVLDAIYRAVQGGHREGTPVSVCGEMAGDPAGALVLLGMEVDSLSMSPASLPRVKQTVRSFTQQRARTLLDAVLGMEDALSVNRLFNGALEETGVDEQSTMGPDDESEPHVGVHRDQPGGPG